MTVPDNRIIISIERERERERERSESELQRWFTIELLKFVSTNIADICAVTTQ